jgi:hypothetical protein
VLKPVKTAETRRSIHLLLGGVKRSTSQRKLPSLVTMDIAKPATKRISRTSMQPNRDCGRRVAITVRTRRRLTLVVTASLVVEVEAVISVAL